jgi:threonine dehydrogenase-like Zn-dependent dehydrogenase
VREYRWEITMKATCWKGPNTVQVEEVPDPKIINARDAIVKISSTAICGSDLHLLQAYVPAMMPGDILGHEFMGEVVEVGPKVKNLEVGDRVVVPFPIACGVCSACQKGMYSLCENSNPNAWMAEKLWGHSGAGIFGYSHLTGGYAGGQAEYARVPFADVNPLKVPEGMTDEQVLFLSDILPTGYMGAEMCDIQPGDVIAVWGAGRSVSSPSPAPTCLGRSGSSRSIASLIDCRWRTTRPAPRRSIMRKSTSSTR